MAHSAHGLRQLDRFFANVLTLDVKQLAQQHFIIGEELLEAEGEAAARAQRALINVCDAIGAAKFPDVWQHERDNAGVNQDAA